ncbi:hypothetical protein FAF44_02955 [Nonomuraea sp. MG754425]|uniref:hypothetical protein n=1 Tax=Nonomuraea sp. MG754425 TaxID=2570319 RepID=UPI001F3657ED|nr:hypothetical protein [Nonomuraea sp. MG754425]MCF6467374.1 hypothetical protein [Nonomuraea sp. MG754425]
MHHDISAFEVSGHSYTVAYDMRSPEKYTVFHEDNPIGTFTHLPYERALTQEVEDLARKTVLG